MNCPEAKKLMEQIPLLTRNNWNSWQWKLRLILNQLGWSFLIDIDIINILMDLKQSSSSSMLSLKNLDQNIQHIIISKIDNQTFYDFLEDLKQKEQLDEKQLTVLISQNTSYQLWIYLMNYFCPDSNKKIINDNLDVYRNLIKQPNKIIKIDAATQTDFINEELIPKKESDKEINSIINQVKENNNNNDDDNEEQNPNSISKVNDTSTTTATSTTKPEDVVISFDLDRWYILARLAAFKSLEDIEKFYVFNTRSLALIWFHNSEDVHVINYRCTFMKKLNEFNDNNRIEAIAMGYHHVIILTNKNICYHLESTKNWASTTAETIKVKEIKDQILKISSGMRHFLMLDQSGKVWAYGNNEQKQIHNNRPLQTEFLRPFKMDISSNHQIDDISCTARGSIFLIDNRTRLKFQGSFKIEFQDTWRWLYFNEYIDFDEEIKFILGGYNSFLVITNDGSKVSLFQSNDQNFKLSQTIIQCKYRIISGYSTCLDDVFILKTENSELYICDPNRNSFHLSKKFRHSDYISEVYNLYSLYPITPVITEMPKAWFKSENNFNDPKYSDLTFQIFHINSKLFKNIYVKKAILFKYSDNLRLWIKRWADEQNQIKIYDYSYVPIYYYLRFIYNGNFDCDQFHFKDLMKISTDFNDDKLETVLKWIEHNPN